MLRLAMPLTLLFATSLLPAAPPSDRPAPGKITKEELKGIETLSPMRQRLVASMLETAQRFNFNRYLFGSADPTKNGFDCSGAVYYLLRKVDLQPPRTSSAQFDWVKKAGNLTVVPHETESLDAPVFKNLKPGDLLFWSGTYKPTDGRTNNITHVQIYLGCERADDLQVMIGSSDGRSYRGKSRCGFGVFDFKLPRKSSKSRLAGFGPPPGLQDAAPPVATEQPSPGP